MALAVLWDSVTYDGEEPTETFSIVTTSSNKQLAFLHERMPVILPDHDAIATWLDTSSGEWTKEHAALLKPFADPDGLECYAVTPEVGKVGNNSSDFIIVRSSSARRRWLTATARRPEEGLAQRLLRQAGLAQEGQFAQEQLAGRPARALELGPVVVQGLGLGRQGQEDRGSHEATGDRARQQRRGRAADRRTGR